MATGKRMAAFFAPLELDISIRSYDEFEHVFRKKCNTAAAAKERETAAARSVRKFKCSPL